MHYTGWTGLTEITGCFKPYLHRLMETTGWFQPYLHRYGARMRHFMTWHQTSFRYGRIHLPILHSYDWSLVMALWGQCDCPLDCGRITLSTTALIAFARRHRVYSPITKPIDDWRPVELGRNITAGNLVTPICPYMPKLRARDCPLPSEDFPTVQPTVIVTQKPVVQGAQMSALPTAACGHFGWVGQPTHGRTCHIRGSYHRGCTGSGTCRRWNHSAQI